MHLPSNLHAQPAIDYSAGSKTAALRETEKVLITQALQRNNGNRAATARELGVHKSTLFRKIKWLGIKA